MTRITPASLCNVFDIHFCIFKYRVRSLNLCAAVIDSPTPFSVNERNDFFACSIVRSLPSGSAITCWTCSITEISREKKPIENPRLRSEYTYRENWIIVIGDPLIFILFIEWSLIHASLGLSGEKFDLRSARNSTTCDFSNFLRHMQFIATRSLLRVSCNE